MKHLTPVNSLHPIIAEWRSKTGKYFAVAQKFENGSGYGFKGDNCVGTLEAKTDAEAIAEVQKKVDRGGYFQPDSIKTPMKRVK